MGYGKELFEDRKDNMYMCIGIQKRQLDGLVILFRHLNNKLLHNEKNPDVVSYKHHSNGEIVFKLSWSDVMENKSENDKVLIVQEIIELGFSVLVHMETLKHPFVQKVVSRRIDKEYNSIINTKFYILKRLSQYITHMNTIVSSDYQKNVLFYLFKYHLMTANLYMDHNDLNYDDNINIVNSKSERYVRNVDLNMERAYSLWNHLYKLRWYGGGNSFSNRYIEVSSLRLNQGKNYEKWKSNNNNNNHTKSFQTMIHTQDFNLICFLESIIFLYADWNHRPDMRLKHFKGTFGVISITILGKDACHILQKYHEHNQKKMLTHMTNICKSFRNGFNVNRTTKRVDSTSTSYISIPVIPSSEIVLFVDVISEIAKFILSNIHHAEHLRRWQLIVSFASTQNHKGAVTTQQDNNDNDNDNDEDDDDGNDNDNDDIINEGIAINEILNFVNANVILYSKLNSNESSVAMEGVTTMQSVQLQTLYTESQRNDDSSFMTMRKLYHPKKYTSLTYKMRKWQQ
jgi:hypothetical protein